MTKRLDLVERVRRRDAIWLREDKSTEERAVMNALAMHEDEGGWSHPSMARIAECTGLTARGCRGILKRLQAVGEIEVIAGGGLHRPNRYRLLLRAETRKELPPSPEPNAEAGSESTRKELPPSTRQELPPSEAKRGSGLQQTRKQTAAKEEPASAEPSLKPVNEPSDLNSRSSVETKTTRRGGRAPRTFMREGWTPRPEDREAVVAAQLDADAIVADFVNYWLAEGKPMANWDAAFRNNVSRIQRSEGLRRKYAQAIPVPPPPPPSNGAPKHGPPVPPPPEALARLRRFARGDSQRLEPMPEEPAEDTPEQLAEREAEHRRRVAEQRARLEQQGGEEGGAA